MSAEEWEAWLDHLTGEDEPFDPEEYADPDGPPPPGEDELTAVEVAEIPEATEAEARAAVQAVRSGATGALAVIAASAGRRGPGQPGSAGQFPRESGSRAAGFGAALALDVMPGGPDLVLLADAAAGRDDRYQGASDDELIGVLCAWDRLEAHMAARKLAAAAELIRRRPEPGCALAGARLCWRPASVRCGSHLRKSTDVRRRATVSRRAWSFGGGFPLRVAVGRRRTVIAVGPVR